MSTKLQKPFLKWIGGKTQIINSIIERFPPEINNYYEPFLGGGSVLLALLTLQQQGAIVISGTIHASDINPSLINVYKHVQTKKKLLHDFITFYISEYDGITGTVVNREAESIEEAKTSKESYYYWIRKKFNEMKRNETLGTKKLVECSALFMFLNKTCFRGMYREGPNGYNVPYGHYKKTPTIITKSNLYTISKLIKCVVFTCSEFNLQAAIPGDFVYIDPPYAPETKTSFVKYTTKGFGLEKHEELFGDVRKIHEKGVKFCMSNSKVSLVLENFQDCNCIDIVARRAINSKNPGSTTTEVIIYN